MLNSTGIEMVKYNLRAFKYQNHEVPHVREWITKKEQELKNIELQNIRKNAAQNKIYKKFKHVNFIIQQIITKYLPQIIIGVIIVVLAAFVVLGINYYFHFNLKP